MKFSVIIPVYNAEQTLERCLRSVQIQNFSDFEAIIVDDGSADQSAAIVRKYAETDHRFRYVYQKNQGVSAARNYGISKAVGEFIVFLDSDDQYKQDYLQQFNKLIAEYPECDHFWCGYESIDRLGREQDFFGYLDVKGKVVISERTEIMSLHEKILDAALWNKVFRKSLIDKYQLKMDEGLSLGEDMLFNYAYLDMGGSNIILIDYPLYIYTKAENGTLNSKYRSDLKQTYDIINHQLLHYLKKWSVSSEQMTKFYNRVFFSMEQVLYNTYRGECLMSSAEKKKFNNELLKSDEFQSVLRLSNCYIHPLYRFAYKAKSWTLIMLLDQIVKIKRMLMRK